MRIKSTYLALLAVLLSPMAANADPIEITFSGSIEIVNAPMFGEVPGTIPVSFSFTYDPSLAPAPLFFPAGGPVGNVANSLQDIYVYDKSGVIDTNFTFGTKTWDSTDFQARSFGPGSVGDIYFDTDISVATPTLTWLLLADLDGSLQIGGGFVSGGTGGLYWASSTISESHNGLSVALSGQYEIGRNVTEVPEPSTLALLGIGLAGMGLSRRRRKLA